MDGDSGRDPRKPVAPHATHARSRRELLALAQSAPGRAGQEEDGERRRRLKAFADRHALSRRQFLQLAGAGGFLVVLESSWPPTQIARGAADLSPAGAFAGSATATPAGGQVQPGARSAGEIDVQQVAPSFVASALRREDMLALRFEFFNLQLQGANVVRQQANQPAYIVVQFVHGTDVAPQAIVEQAFLKADEFQSDSELDPNDEPAPSEALAPPGSVGATLAGASRLAFRVPDDIDTIPFTLNDLLAWVNYEQSVASHALPRPRIIVAPEIIGILSGEPTAGATFNQIIIDPGIIIDLLRLIREPSAVETAIEAPGELIVSPSRLAGWAHALQPVTHDSRTELWHTRLGVRGQIPGSPGMWQVNETASFFRTIRAVWTPGFQRDVAPNPDVPGAFRTSLTPNDRWQLVRLTSDSLIPGFTPAPIEVNRLMLTALGAWLDVSGAWSPPPDPSEQLDISEWRHIATMGRDHYVRVVYEGFLYPLGHAAALVKVTERTFEPVASGPMSGSRAAYLRQRFFIVVREPERAYGGGGEPSEGRLWPFRRVRITTLVTPTLENPSASSIAGAGQQAFWPRVNVSGSGRDFEFHAVGTDWDGQTSEWTLPLAFVSRTRASDDAFVAQANAEYGAAGARRRAGLEGQRVALAPSSQAEGLPGGEPGDTATEVKELTLGGVPPDPNGGAVPAGRPRFFPTWTEAEVRLPGVEQLKGGALDPVVIEPAPQWVEVGFDGGNPGDIDEGNPGAIYAQLKQTVPLTFTGSQSSDKSGGLITPDMAISALSRTLGPVGGLPQKLPTLFDPSEFFANAKLMGGILLADILAKGLDLAEAPGLTHQVIYPNGDTAKAPQAVETRFKWKVVQPQLQKDEPLHVFEPLNGSLTVDGTFITPLDPPGEPTFNIVGDLRNFQINMVGDGALKVLVLKFNKLVFTAQTGTKPNVDPDIREVEFAGVLSFVNTLRQFLHSSNPGPFVDVTPTGVTAGYSLEIPTIAVGVLSLQNVALGAALNLPFTGAPARVRFHFSEREDPFLVTVYGIGGGGFFNIGLGLDGVELLEASFEFGAVVAIDLGIAAGEVHLLGGVYYKAEQVEEQGQQVEQIVLTAYIRMGGSLAILGIVTVSLEFYLALQYQDPPNELWGQATLTIEIDVLFFSQPIELSVERRLAGPSNGQSAAAGGLRVAQLGGGERFSELVEEGDWEEYVAAFAPVTAAPDAPAGADLRSLTLLSGWNLVGWVGATTTRAEATAGIAGAFDHMFTFDAATQTFRRFSPAAPSLVNTLSEVRSGDGVWIFVPQTATWTQPVASGSLSLSLLPGFNMVAWAGPDNMPVVDALASIADKLKVAFAYDAQQQRFRSYRPELPTSLSDLSVFREGDGVFLDMNQAASWPQPAPEGAGG